MKKYKIVFVQTIYEVVELELKVVQKCNEQYFINEGKFAYLIVGGIVALIMYGFNLL